MFTVTDPRLVDAAVLILQWPFSYATNSSNVEKHLAPHFARNSGLKIAVDALVALQSALPTLPSSETAWHAASKVIRQHSSNSRAIHTAWPAEEAAQVEEIARELDAPLYESLSIALHRKKVTATRPCSLAELDVLTQCVWLSSHIALCVLGVARAIAEGVNVRFQVADLTALSELRRAWFGVAFDKHVRQTDELRLWTLARSGQLRFLDVLCIFSKHWRLNGESASDSNLPGALFKLADTVLIPSTKLLLACAKLSDRRLALHRVHARELDCVREFDLIQEHMQSLPIVNRALQYEKNGLSLGSLQLVPGLLSLAERIARENFGDNWHDSLGPELARYLTTRLDKVNGIRIVETELRQHMTAGADVPIDVDLFIVDERADRVYAIQCKHLEGSHGIGLLDWLERFRRHRDGKRKGLDKAVQQLENLAELCEKDAKVRKVLTETVGLTPHQIETIRPIVVHNLWNVDFWRTSQGICFYDLHTFCNGIKGREAIVGSLRPNEEKVMGLIHGDAVVDMSDPDAVISAYVNDPNWLRLARYDAVARVSRATTVNGVVVTAEGLGI